jgi:tetratricopeptide (TPR) repeat protein
MAISHSLNPLRASPFRRPSECGFRVPLGEHRPSEIAHVVGNNRIEGIHAQALFHMRDTFFSPAKHIRHGERAEALALARAHARAALDLDWNSAVAHARLGAVYTWQEELDRGLSECEIAIELNPSDAVTRMQLGNRLDLLGRTEEGVAHMEQGLRMNPFDPIVADYMGYLARRCSPRGTRKPHSLGRGKGWRADQTTPTRYFASPLAWRPSAIPPAQSAHSMKPRPWSLASCQENLSGPLQGPGTERPLLLGLRRHSLH